MRTVVDFRSYYEVVSDLVGVMHLKAATCWAHQGAERRVELRAHARRLQDGSRPGARLSTRGLGPRDITPGTSGDALGGTYYWGASLEVQYPFYFLPKDEDFRGAVFVDSGAEWGYKGETSWPSNGEINGTVTTSTGASYFCGNCALQLPICGSARVGRRQLNLGLAVRAFAFRFRLSDPEAALRPRSVVPVRRRYAVLIAPPICARAGVRFRSSQGLAARSDANFESRDTSRFMMLVRFSDLKFLYRICRLVFGSAAVQHRPCPKSA